MECEIREILTSAMAMNMERGMRTQLMTMMSLTKRKI
jgi:hypothetical protein